MTHYLGDISLFRRGAGSGMVLENLEHAIACHSDTEPRENQKSGTQSLLPVHRRSLNGSTRSAPRGASLVNGARLCGGGGLVEADDVDRRRRPFCRAGDLIRCEIARRGWGAGGRGERAGICTVGRRTNRIRSAPDATAGHRQTDVRRCAPRSGGCTAHPGRLGLSFVHLETEQINSEKTR